MVGFLCAGGGHSPCFCDLAEGFIALLVPVVREETVVLTFGRPTSNAYRSIELRSHSRSLQSLNEPLAVRSVSHDSKIVLTRSDGTLCTVVVDESAEHIHDVAKAGSQDSLPLDATGLTTWLQANGVTGDAEQINKEMANAVGQMRPGDSSP